MNTIRILIRGVAAASLVLVAAQAHAAGAIESHSATVNGVKISYLQEGQGSETPVVLLHGYAETSHMWLPLMPKLADRRVVIAPDLRGSGSSEKSKPPVRASDDVSIDASGSAGFSSFRCSRRSAFAFCFSWRFISFCRF